MTDPRINAYTQFLAERIGRWVLFGSPSVPDIDGWCRVVSVDVDAGVFVADTVDGGRRILAVSMAIYLHAASDVTDARCEQVRWDAIRVMEGVMLQ